MVFHMFMTLWMLMSVVSMAKVPVHVPVDTENALCNNSVRCGKILQCTYQCCGKLARQCAFSIGINVSNVVEHNIMIIRVWWCQYLCNKSTKVQTLCTIYQCCEQIRMYSHCSYTPLCSYWAGAAHVIVITCTPSKRTYINRRSETVEANEKTIVCFVKCAPMTYVAACWWACQEHLLCLESTENVKPSHNAIHVSLERNLFSEIRRLKSKKSWWIILW